MLEVEAPRLGRREGAEGVLAFWQGVLEVEAPRIEEVRFALGWVEGVLRTWSLRNERQAS